MASPQNSLEDSTDSECQQMEAAVAMSSYKPDGRKKKKKEDLLGVGGVELERS